MPEYLLDACALIALLNDEKGADIVSGLLDLPCRIIETLHFDIIREAARIKAVNKMSFADTLLVATAHCTGATVVTCDHLELEPIEQLNRVNFLWIRP